MRVSQLTCQVENALDLLPVYPYPPECRGYGGKRKLSQHRPFNEPMPSLLSILALERGATRSNGHFGAFRAFRWGGGVRREVETVRVGIEVGSQQAMVRRW